MGLQHYKSHNNLLVIITRNKISNKSTITVICLIKKCLFYLYRKQKVSFTSQLK